MAEQNQPPAGPDLAAGLPVSEVTEGGPVSGRVGGEAVLLVRHGEAFLAVSATCTHYSGPLGDGVVTGDTMRCPWHHACFSLRTGEALRAPAIDPIACWRTEAVGDRIFVREKLAAPPPRPKSGSGSARFVIVGGGAAGFAAAERLRRDGFDGSLVMLSEEDSPPVDRPNLSKDFLAGKAAEDWVFVKPAGFYPEHGIDLHLGTPVTALDARAKTLVVADGRTFGFDWLLLATGAEPVRLTIPGADAPHVFTLRSFADCRAIIQRAAASKVAVVIGASFIGLEVAASLIQRGLEVHVVAPEQRPLENVLGPEFGDFIRAEHEAHGVVFHLGHKPVAIDARQVSLDDGSRLTADLVVMGVGVRPRIDLARQAGLAGEQGVPVDRFLETPAPGIFAAGDIARFPSALGPEGTLRVEHFVVAEQQGQIAAANMLGQREPYERAPFFWSQHYDVPINVSGHPGKWDERELVGDLKARDGLVRYRRAGTIVAVASIFRDQENLQTELALEAPVRR